MTRPPSTPLTLPSLRYLKVAGKYPLTAISFNRPMEEISLDMYLHNEDIAELVSQADGTILGSSLRTLSIKLAHNVAIGIGLQLFQNAFPSLRHLRVEQASMDLLVSRVQVENVIVAYNIRLR